MTILEIKLIFGHATVDLSQPRISSGMFLMRLYNVEENHVSEYFT